MRLAFIVPIHNRAATIGQCLLALAPLRRRGHRVIVVDGGSSDDGAVCAAPLADRIVLAPRGWPWQCNAGSRAPEAEGADALVFLADSVRLPADADRAIARALSNSRSPWGAFAVRFDPARRSHALPVRLAAYLANLCTRATGICTREQAVFITRAAFLALEGYDGPEASADIDFCRRVASLGPPIVLGDTVVAGTSVAGLRPFLAAVLRHEGRRVAGALGVGAAAAKRSGGRPT